MKIDIFLPDLSTHIALPYADGGIQAGFPSPAQDYISESIDLNREIVRHPSATFYGRVSGESMIDEGICEGDILVIDRSLKRIRLESGRIWLVPSNEMYDPILVTPERQFEVWGVVTHTIKNNRRPR